MNQKVCHKIVTLVFSDIEHSTQLAQQLREDYPALLDKQRDTIREALKKDNGKEIDTSGDGFFMAFDNPDKAIQACTEVQKKFHLESWAMEIGLKVRIGIHTGEVMLTNSGYTGVEVHKASRICDAAFGGQVILSGATMKQLPDGKGKGIDTSFIGEYRLKDIGHSVKLFQLNITDIHYDFSGPRIPSEEKKIAVVPFRDTSLNQDYEYLSDGITEEIILALSKIGGLRVASRSTSFALKSHQINLRETGKLLGVDSFLDGRIRIEDGQISVSVELIDAHTGFNIWAEQFQEKREQLVNIQDTIVQKISNVLNYHLPPSQVDTIMQRQSKNVEAYDYYLRGRRFYSEFNTRGIKLAIQMFEKAIIADNAYSLAYAGLADCYSYLYQHRERTDKVLHKADHASKKAIGLAPKTAEGFVSRGIVLGLKGEFEDAEKYFQKAIEHDPTMFQGWFHYGRACFVAGIPDKAARLFQQANRVEPDDFQSILLSAQIYHDMGSEDFARILRRRGVEIAEKCMEIDPGNTRALYLAANALALLQEKEKSLKYLHSALLLEPDDSMVLYNAGCVYSLLGMKKEALTCLERSYEAGLTLKGWYENDSNLDVIRGEKQFIQLMEKLNLNG